MSNQQPKEGDRCVGVITKISETVDYQYLWCATFHGQDPSWGLWQKTKFGIRDFRENQLVMFRWESWNGTEHYFWMAEDPNEELETNRQEQ